MTASSLAVSMWILQERGAAASHAEALQNPPMMVLCALRET